MTNNQSVDTRTGYRTTLQRTAAIVGGVFLVVGILGFVPGITSNFDQLTFASHDSQAKLLGLFQVSVLHNIVHLLFGIAGLLMARRERSAYTYLVGGGVIYLLLWLYGLFIDKQSAANFVPVNSADDWLHFLLGAGMVAAGVLLRNRTRRSVDPARTR